MRVIVYPGDEGGCGFYRLIAPGTALAEQGHPVRVVPSNSTDDLLLLRMYQGPDGREHVHSFETLPDADLVVFQRPMNYLLAEAIPFLQDAGIAVVVEVDDDFERIAPNNIAFKHTHPKYSPDRNWMNLRHACQMADWVTVSTPALAKRYGKHGRCSVIPNYVPRSYLSIPTWDDGGQPVVIWSGSVLTHADDLAILRGVLPHFARQTDATVRVVGTGKGVEFRLGVPVEACGWQELPDYPGWMAQGTVGVVPLTLTDFNEAKSSLKGLEFASVGVPFVASPTGPYRELAKAGVGAVAARPREWLGAMQHVLRNRADLSFQYRAIVAAHYTLEANAWRWWDAWEKAHARRISERDGGLVVARRDGRTGDVSSVSGADLG